HVLHVRRRDPRLRRAARPAEHASPLPVHAERAQSTRRGDVARHPSRARTRPAAAPSRAPHRARAREVFAANPDVAVYLFGHTHDAFLEREPDGRVIANMGTWLKILRRVPVRFGYLPSVYYPSFRLNYFHIFAEQSRLVMRY